MIKAFKFFFYALGMAAGLSLVSIITLALSLIVLVVAFYPIIVAFIVSITIDNPNTISLWVMGGIIQFVWLYKAEGVMMIKAHNFKKRMNKN